jgi:hypothetical protein
MCSFSYHVQANVSLKYTSIFALVPFLRFRTDSRFVLVYLTYRSALSCDRQVREVISHRPATTGLLTPLTQSGRQDKVLITLTFE